MDLKELHGVSVFVIDDNPNNLNVIKDHLIQNGLKPIPIKSGEEALYLIKKIQPDIILLDVQMPGGIDGFETCRRFKKESLSRDIPVIFVSAISETVDKVKGFSAGGVDYISKPIEAEELLSRIYVHVTISKLQKELYSSKANLETVVEKRTKELESYKSYLTSIIDSMDPMVISVDDSCNIVHWNRSAEEITGVKSGDSIGKKFIELFKDMKEEEKLLIDVINTGKSRQINKKAFIVGGEIQYKDILFYPIESNPNYGAVIVIDDITSRIQMEEMVVHNEKMISIGGLAAGMAHEINNPLAGILQNSNVLENRLFNKLETSKSLEIAREIDVDLKKIKLFMIKRKIPNIIQSITESGKRLGSIVESMLNFARRNVTKFEMNSISDMLDKSIDLAGLDYNMKKRYDFKLITIIKEYEESVPDIVCDKIKLQQVFLNILHNGAQAMYTSKTEKPQFNLRIKNIKDYVEINIEDNGPGIDKSKLQKIFEPFYTTKEPGLGTGLGLSVSHFIITENHKGTISVKSKLGEGTNFIIYLPKNLKA